MLRIVEDATKLKNYQRQFERQLQRKGTRITRCCIRTPDPEGPTPADVIWLASAGIWFYSDLAKEGNRWWNVFGIGKPRSNSTVSPVCEICVPKKIINRRIAGGFAEEGSDVFLIHRGNKYGGGKPGMTKEYFWSHYHKSKLKSARVIDGKQENEVAVIARLGEAGLGLNIAAFVKWMRDIQKK